MTYVKIVCSINTTRQFNLLTSKGSVQTSDSQKGISAETIGQLDLFLKHYDFIIIKLDIFLKILQLDFSENTYMGYV